MDTDPQKSNVHIMDTDIKESCSFHRKERWAPYGYGSTLRIWISKNAEEVCGYETWGAGVETQKNKKESCTTIQERQKQKISWNQDVGVCCGITDTRFLYYMSLSAFSWERSNGTLLVQIDLKHGLKTKNVTNGYQQSGYPDCWYPFFRNHRCVTVAVCCSVLHYAAVCCSVCAAAHCSIMQHNALHCNSHTSVISPAPHVPWISISIMCRGGLWISIQGGEDS